MIKLFKEYKNGTDKNNDFYTNFYFKKIKKDILNLFEINLYLLEILISKIYKNYIKINNFNIF